jgi:hypothetical protein
LRVKFSRYRLLTSCKKVNDRADTRPWGVPLMRPPAKFGIQISAEAASSVRIGGQRGDIHGAVAAKPFHARVGRLAQMQPSGLALDRAVKRAAHTCAHPLPPYRARDRPAQDRPDHGQPRQPAGVAVLDFKNLKPLGEATTPIHPGLTTFLRPGHPSTVPTSAPPAPAG